MPWICHYKLFLILVWIFITNDDVDNENLDLTDPASSILTISTMDMVSQNYEAQILIAIDVRYLPLDMCFQSKQRQ